MKHSQREKTNWETKNQMRLEEARKTDRQFTCTPAENCMKSERERSFFLLQESTSLQFLFPRSGKDFFLGHDENFEARCMFFTQAVPFKCFRRLSPVASRQLTCTRFMRYAFDFFETAG